MAFFGCPTTNTTLLLIQAAAHFVENVVYCVCDTVQSRDVSAQLCATVQNDKCDASSIGRLHTLDLDEMSASKEVLVFKRTAC